MQRPQARGVAGTDNCRTRPRAESSRAARRSVVRVVSRRAARHPRAARAPRAAVSPGHAHCLPPRRLCSLPILLSLGRLPAGNGATRWRLPNSPRLLVMSARWRACTVTTHSHTHSGQLTRFFTFYSYDINGLLPRHQVLAMCSRILPLLCCVPDRPSSECGKTVVEPT